MAQPSKRVKKISGLVDRSKAYELKIALDLVKKTATAKFDESVDVAVNLGIDAKKSDQVVRGSVVLPRGTGKTVRVAVFAQGANAEKARAAGADIVGFDDLAEKVKGGFMDFDVVIATPDAMKVVGPLGQVQYRADKSGIVQCTIGRASFEVDALAENFDALLGAIGKAKPASLKGIYLKKISVSSTMGVGIKIDHSGMAGAGAPAAH